MKFKIVCFLFFMTSLYSFGNDGAFFASGNQLIPINESDISIKKEILTLKKIRNQFIEVTVYYEFYNPNAEKTITVGFEAFAPEGDVDGAPRNGMHPYMRDFTVDLNDKILKYNVAYVADSLYVKNGKINTIDLNSFEGNTAGNNIDFYYVYYFEAKFKKGLNIIKHTYNYDLSGSIDYKYHFDYVLTAAGRWANKQIDDFTLIIDNGEFEIFNIDKTFFKNNNEWLINGIGKVSDYKDKEGLHINDGAKFIIQKGNIIFQKKNFKLEGDLFVYSKRNFEEVDISSYVPFSYYNDEKIGNPSNEFEKKILRNLPFARRGYVFKNKELSEYFTSLDWYIPNANYEPITEILSEHEKKWIDKWK